jgi:FkbM family methyltransferase
MDSADHERMPTIMFLTPDKYSVSFKAVSIDERKYFTPEFALHRPAVQAILNKHLYEPETHNLVRRLFAGSNGSLVHAGAFFGDMLPSFSQSVQHRIYAFEPVLESYVLAKLCVEVNQLTNVLLYNCALSDSISNVYMNTEMRNGLHAGGTSTVSKNGQICSTITIDSLNDPSIQFIHLDVEGHELPALQGALQTIQKFRPLIAVEDNANNCTALFAHVDYELVRQYPGLNIWIPIEDTKMQLIIES